VTTPEQPDPDFSDPEPPNPLVPPPPSVPHAATRHMCVGCYVDHEFRERAMTEVYLDRSRQVAPAYGYDLVPVLVHARRAGWIDHAQHVLVILVALFWIRHDLFAAAITVSTVITWYVLKRFGRLFRDYAGYIRHRGSLAERSHLRRRFRWLTAGLIAPWIAVIGVAFYTARSILDSHAAHPGHVAIEVVRTLLSLIAVVVAAAVVRQICIDSLANDPSRPRTYSHRIEQLRAEQYRPITVFSGYRPYVGSGFEVRTWSFAQRLRRIGEGSETPFAAQPDDNRRPSPIPAAPGEPPFRTLDLIEHIKQSVNSLANDVNPELRLPGLRIYDKAFVGGFRTAKLVGVSDDASIYALLANPSDPDRHYITCEIVALNGEVVATVFVHAGIQAHALYLEFTSWAMPPTRLGFQIVDLRRGRGLPAYLTAIGRVIVRMPAELGRAPAGLGILLRRPFYALRPGFDRARDQLRDVGARLSLRELAANVRTNDKGQVDEVPAVSYFQGRDIVKYLQIIERRLLSTVMEYIEDLGLDTTEFKQRARAILNDGALSLGSGDIHGGSRGSINILNSGNLTMSGAAIGHNSTVSVGSDEAL
jgi:hypothetical protein